MSLKANEAEGLRGLLRMSSVAGLSAAVASTTTLCCAQLASSASWSVVGMSSDLGTCQAYGLTTAPCVLRHSSKLLFTADSQFPVACTGDDGDITTIKLAGASLAGALPASLKGGPPDNSGGSFSSLSRLDLSSNSLTNISPAQLGTLSTLQEIDLSSALLTAVNNVAMHDILALLMAIGQSGASNGLRIITITSNHLAGHFPPNFASSMQHLTTLDLAGNKMSAAIPDFSLSASSLQKLHLQNNLLTGTIPAGIFSLSGGSSPSLQEVWLQSNQLTGTLPNFVAASSGTHQLRSFKLDDNVGISGTIPGNINVATELHTLLIGSEDASKMQMHLSGTIPAGANQLKWRELGLSRNKLSGSFPTNMFANAPAELAKVHLAYNRLTGELPNMLTSCPLSTLPSGATQREVSEMDLRGNLLSGTLPAVIGTFQLMTKLLLEDNHLSGSIPSDLGNMYRLLNVELGDNKFTGALPSLCCSSCSCRMKELTIKDNQFSGLLSGVDQLTELLDLEAEYNHLQAVGSLPPALTKLHLQNNRLYEDISQMQFQSTMTALHDVSLANNLLFGDLGAAMAPLTGLQTIDATNNNFTGHFPTFTGPNLRKVMLGRNQLDGTIPSFFCSGARTQTALTIIADDNSLTGSWPRCASAHAWMSSAALSLHLANNAFDSGFFQNGDPLVGRVTELDLSGSSAIGSGAAAWLPLLSSATIIKLSGIGLSGDLATIVAGLSHSLRHLDLSGNALTGNLNDRWQNFIHLEVVNLAQNQLSGGLSYLSQMFTPTARASSSAGALSLYLSGNQFSGNLDFLITNQASLHIDHFDVTGNTLSGNLPADLRHLPIRYFLIGGNSFSGTMPVLPPACHDPFSATTNYGQTAACIGDASKTTVATCVSSCSNPIYTTPQTCAAAPSGLETWTARAWSGATCLQSVDLSSNPFDCPAPSTPPPQTYAPWVNYVYQTASCTCQAGSFVDAGGSVSCADDSSFTHGYGGCAVYAAGQPRAAHCVADGAHLACPVTCNATCVTPAQRQAAGQGPTPEESRAFCAPAEKGYFAQQINTYSQSMCTVGRWSDSLGTTDCSYCPAGQFGVGVTAVCSNLAGGALNPDGIAVFDGLRGAGTNASHPDYGRCAPVAQEVTVNGVYIGGCMNCSVGRYQTAQGAVTCDACGVGKKGLGGGGAATEPAGCQCCDTGTYSTATAALQCVDSSIGHFVPSICRENMTWCNLGTYQDREAQDSCKICTPGNEPNVGRVACEMCDVGFESTDGRKCKICSPGRFSDQPMTTNCSAAPPGAFVPQPTAESIVYNLSVTLTLSPELLRTVRAGGRVYDTTTSAYVTGTVASPLPEEQALALAGHDFLSHLGASVGTCSDGVSTSAADCVSRCHDPLMPGGISTLLGGEPTCIGGTCTDAAMATQAMCKGQHNNTNTGPGGVTSVCSTVVNGFQETCARVWHDRYWVNRSWDGLAAAGAPYTYTDDPATAAPAAHYGEICHDDQPAPAINTTLRTVRLCLNAVTHTERTNLTALSSTLGDALAARIGGTNFGVRSDGGRRRLSGTGSVTVGAPFVTATTLRVHWLALQERFLQSVHRSAIATALADSSACNAAKVSGAVASCDGAHLTGLAVTPLHPLHQLGGAQLVATFDEDMPSAVFAEALTTAVGATHFVQCPAFTYQDTAGSDACKTCLAGHTVNTLQTGCVPCPAGHENTDGRECTPCLSGYYQPATGQAACLPAPKGGYVALPGAVGFQDCPPKLVQTREAQVECDVCIPGYVADSAGTGCLGCPAGRHEQLPAGFPFDRFGRPCVEPNGVNNAEGCRSLECEDCLAGQYQDQVGETECNPAGYGHYVAVAGANNQSLCPLTQYQDTRGQTHCKTCTPGRQPNSGMIRTHCEWCLPGHFSPIGLKCHACESGQYQPSNGSRACHHAEPGSYVDLKMATHQWDCPDGSYAPSPGTVNCGPCRGGHTNNNESVDCHACAPGKAGHKQCKFPAELDEYGRCPQEGDYEYVTVRGATALQFCEDCRPGRFSAYNGTTQCTLSPRGMFVAGVAATAPTRCQAGTVAPRFGMTACETCPVGKSPDGDLIGCSDCPPGSISPNGTHCANCLRGRYQPLPGMGLCEIAEAGHYVAREGQTAQLVCEKGTYQNETGQYECKTCAPGEGPAPEFPAAPVRCELCAVNFHSLAGAECLDCGPGFTTPGRGAVNCSDVNECDSLASACHPLTYTALKDNSPCTNASSPCTNASSPCTNWPGGYSCDGWVPIEFRVGKFTNFTGLYSYSADGMQIGPCGVGYSGDGKGEDGCLDLDECLARPCKAGHSCSDSTEDLAIPIGEYKCEDPNLAVYIGAAIAGLVFCCFFAMFFFMKKNKEDLEGEEGYSKQPSEVDVYREKHRHLHRRRDVESESDAEADAEDEEDEEAPMPPRSQGTAEDWKEVVGLLASAKLQQWAEPMHTLGVRTLDDVVDLSRADERALGLRKRDKARLHAATEALEAEP